MVQPILSHLIGESRKYNESATIEHARDFSKNGRQIKKMMDRQCTNYAIKEITNVWQLMGASQAPINSGIFCASLGEHDAGNIHTMPTTTQGRQFVRVIAGTAG